MHLPLIGKYTIFSPSHSQHRVEYLEPICAQRFINLNMKFLSSYLGKLSILLGTPRGLGVACLWQQNSHNFCPAERHCRVSRCWFTSVTGHEGKPCQPVLEVRVGSLSRLPRLHGVDSIPSGVTSSPQCCQAVVSVDVLHLSCMCSLAKGSSSTPGAGL